MKLQNYATHVCMCIQGITTYYSANCTTEDAEFIKDFMTEKVGMLAHMIIHINILHTQNLSAYNTRVFKQSSNDGDAYELRMASVATGSEFISTGNLLIYI